MEEAHLFEHQAWELVDVLEPAEIARLRPEQTACLLRVLQSTEHFETLEAPGRAPRGASRSSEAKHEGEEVAEEGAYAFDASTIPVHSAFSLTSAEVIAELTSRGLQGNGFFNDDAKLLQRVFEAEREARVSELRETHEQRIFEKRAEKARHQFLLHMARRLSEEARCVLRSSEGDEYLTWLTMLARNDTPSTVCLSALTRAAADPCACARSLAKTLYFNGSVTALDLGKARLEDAAGAYLARALRATASRLVTLDLDDNALGPRTCSAFAETLPHATRLKSLGLQGNDLTQRGRYPHQFAAFCAALGASSLARLDLWRCLLDAPAGAALALGVRESQLLVQVELGGNDVALDDRRLVDAWLARNRETADESRRTELRAEDEGRERSAAERDARDSRQKEADVDAFIERRRCERKDDRETQAREAKEKEDEERSQRAYKEKYRLDALAKAQNDKHTKASKKKKKK